MAEQWVCSFVGLAGARARAVFASEEQARRFAEQHAMSLSGGRIPLEWNGSSDHVELATPIGTYSVVRSSDA